MPLSDHRQLGTVLDAVLKREPQDILDIGIGHGLYGTALRQYLGEHVSIMGVEPFSDYQWTADHRDRWWAYDVVLRGEPWPIVARHLSRPTFDIALLVDVLEHMDELTGQNAIRAALIHSRALVIATPHDPLRFPQDDLPNPLERHVRRWPLWEIAELAAAQGWALVEAERLADSVVVVLEA